jgi:tryptophan synthase alpha chain
MKPNNGMTRIEKCFAAAREKGSKALVGFVCAGDPDLATSLDITTSMCDAGLDVLELGVPFSDPTADGPVIQRAAGRALRSGATLTAVLEMTRTLRQRTEVPIILFSYYNPIFAYGVDAFYRDSKNAGADGVLVVDLPYEESRELTDAWAGDDGFSLIRLIAPTTPKERMKKIAGSGSCFLYLVSKTGVTGSSGLDVGSVGKYVADVRSVTALPLCVGFGVNEPDQARQLAPFADGVVVGSAFERTIEQNIGSQALPSRVGEQVKAFKAALGT